MINWKELTKPFNEDELEWRLQSCGEKNGRFWGKVLCYVTNRAIQQRLDDVIGVDNWHNEYKQIDGKEAGMLCGISIRVTHEDGTSEWVTKWDGADNTDIESVKGGLSGAMKRAAVQWGIGRYLYGLKENWAKVSDSGIYNGKTKDGRWFKWNPPELPSWALPNDITLKKTTSQPKETVPQNVAKPSPSQTNVIIDDGLLKLYSNEQDAKTLKDYIEDNINRGVLKGAAKDKALSYADANDVIGMRGALQWCARNQPKAV